MDVTEAERGETALHVVGIGASAGGVDALTQLVRHLPANLPAAICIVLHIPALGRSLLAPILNRHTDLEVRVAGNGEALRAGRVYVAPNDRHLLVSDGVLELERGPKENGVRPAVDPMLRTLAAAYGPRAIAVILSGALGDGSSGAIAVRDAGGAVIVQDPEDAPVPGMPESALRAVGTPDAVLPATAIARELERLVARQRIGKDRDMAPHGDAVEESRERPDGPPSTFTCPECHGPLWQVEDGDLVRFRCRVGHGYTEDALVIEQGSAVEAALWMALQALDERAEFLARVAARYADSHPRLRDRFEQAATDAVERAELIRRALGTTGDRPLALEAQPGVVE